VRHKRFYRPRGLAATAVFVLAFMYVPIFIALLFSFNSIRSFQRFEGVSLRWYEAVFDDPAFTDALTNSFIVAGVVALVATPLGTIAAIGLVRARNKLATGGNFLFLLPLVIPELALAAALLLVFAELNADLSLSTIILAHITFMLAFVVVIVRARLVTLNPVGEEAAMDLGASRFKAVMVITVPALMPAIVAAALFVFAFSFDNFLLSLFLAGETSQTLPVRIYSQIRLGVQPTVNALGGIMFAVTMLCFLLGAFVLWRGRRRSLPVAEVGA